MERGMLDKATNNKLRQIIDDMVANAIVQKFYYNGPVTFADKLALITILCLTGDC